MKSPTCEVRVPFAVELALAITALTVVLAWLDRRVTPRNADVADRAVGHTADGAAVRRSA